MDYIQKTVKKPWMDFKDYKAWQEFIHTTNKYLKNMKGQISIGERKVRTFFNPAKDSKVDQIKQKTAELINLINDYNETLVGEFSTKEDIEFQNKEIFRLKALAMTAYEEGCMWAVKAVTV